MPNHFHGIIVIVGADLRVCPQNETEGAHAESVSKLYLQLDLGTDSAEFFSYYCKFVCFSLPVRY